jgi:hypothetical protein
MAIKDIYKQAITALSNEKAQAVEQIKQKATQEIIVPHNSEVDKKLAEAIRELEEKHNKQVIALQNGFNAERQNFIDLATAEKKDFAEKTINAECELVRIEYDTAISHIREKMQEDEA